ncbi:MAG: GHKL domain-containing protein [Oligoflexia bacterium]|nr:GHKL domain-containing protein [Oligoflexia bacterium]
MAYLEKQGLTTLPLIDAFDYPEEYLKDPHSWISLTEAEKFFEKAIKITDDLLVARHCGLLIKNLSALGALDNVFKMMTDGAQSYYSRIDRYLSYFLAPQPIYNELERTPSLVKFEFPIERAQFPNVFDFLIATLEVLPKYTGHGASQVKLSQLNIVEISWETKQQSLFEEGTEGRVLNPKLVEQMSVLLQDSERKIEELKLENKRLADRLKEQIGTHSLAVLAAGVAHEINNPLSFVTSNITRFKEYFEVLKQVASQTPSENFKKQFDLDFILSETPLMLQESLEGLHRVKEIVRDLSALAHPDQGRTERKIKTDLNELLESSVKVITQKNMGKIKIKKQLKLGEKVALYPVRMSQVFVNLLSNAAQAIEDKGVIEVKTWAEKNNAIIEIKDSGHGMDEETKKNIFTPFFTTKTQGQGMGLGLSIAQSIIEMHKGKMSVNSMPGQGSIFTIELPIN